MVEAGHRDRCIHTQNNMVNAADGILRARQTHVKRQQWNVRVFGAHSGHRIIYSVYIYIYIYTLNYNKKVYRMVSSINAIQKYTIYT